MNVAYDKEHKILHIDDGLKTRNTIIICCVMLNICLSYLKLRTANLFHLNFEQFSWLAIGSFSLLYIFLFLIKYSFAEKIPIDDIFCLEKHEKHAGYTFFIILKNGKKRKLYKLKTLDEFNEFTNYLKKIDENNID
ncbi:MAG: hypothetical protein ACR2MS_08685 [Weeksellaceae bacterium]